MPVEAWAKAAQEVAAIPEVVNPKYVPIPPADAVIVLAAVAQIAVFSMSSPILFCLDWSLS